MSWRLLNFLLIIFLWRVNVYAAELIVLEKEGFNREHFFHGEFLDLLEDRTGKLSLADVLSGPYSSKFRYDSIRVSGNYNLESYYWGRFTVKNKSDRAKGWVIELYDFKTDYFELYIPDGKGGFIKKSGGDQFDFSSREYEHKNFVFDLPELPSGASKTFYLRIYSRDPVAIIGVVRTLQRFLKYSTTEYYLLALFYGILLAIASYNVLLFLNVRELSYLFLASYILGFAIYCMTQDGTGFQFFWPSVPVMNVYAPHFFLLVVMVSIILYARSFLVAKKSISVIDKWISILIVCRSVLFLSTIFYHHVLLHRSITLFDFFTAFLIFLAGIYSYYFKKYTPARYYVLAFAFLFTGFIITMMHALRWIDAGVYLAAYAFNGGAVLQIFFLSLSVGNRMRMLISEKEQLRDRLNEELEVKVSERTKELQDKNRQLDSFVYKASHDIKGPLKSIIGLTSVALKDIRDPAAHEYFHHILKSTNRLDTLLHDLLSLTKMQKEVVVEPSLVDLKQMIQDIWLSFTNLPETEKMHFEMSVKDVAEFYSDRKLLYSVCQNLIENAIKYRDADKKISLLLVSIVTGPYGAEITFSDNGIGIPYEYKDKIFEMFAKVNNYSNGFGLGLHMVQLSLSKLQGTVEVTSMEGEGSVFCVRLPQIYPSNSSISKEISQAEVSGTGI